MTLLLDRRQRTVENLIQTGTGLCNSVMPALIFFFSNILHFAAFSALVASENVSFQQKRLGQHYTQ